VCRVYLPLVALNRDRRRSEQTAEKAVYTPESSRSSLFVLAMMLWLLPQLAGQAGAWRILPASIVALFVAWSGVTSAVSASAWYRNGLDSRLMQLARVGGSCRALNAFCGTGSLAVALGTFIHSGEVVASDQWKPTKKTPDPSRRTRDNVRIEGVGHIVTVQEADPRDLPFKPNRFNVVGSRFGLSGVRKDRRQMVLELFRVLKNGGSLVLAESLPVALWLRYRVLPPLVRDYRVADVRLSRFHFTAIVSATKIG
jgi:SAM-dependent methyltransferase